MTKKRAETNGRPARPKRAKRAVAPVQWKSHLDLYEDLRAVQFLTQEDYAAGAKLLWNELRAVPFDILGMNTIIVPAEACPYFKGLSFIETEVLRPGDLSAAELAELRREQGPY